MFSYRDKYLKYKLKYQTAKLQKIAGGGTPDTDTEKGYTQSAITFA